MPSSIGERQAPLHYIVYLSKDSFKVVKKWTRKLHQCLAISILYSEIKLQSENLAFAQCERILKCNEILSWTKTNIVALTQQLQSLHPSGENIFQYNLLKAPCLPITITKYLFIKMDGVGDNT